MEGRWTIWTTAKCDRDCILKCADAGGLPRSATPVVPCDDAAIERAADALEASDKDYRYVSREDIRATVEAIFAAAASDAEAAILAARAEQTARIERKA